MSNFSQPEEHEAPHCKGSKYKCCSFHFGDGTEILTYWSPIWTTVRNSYRSHAFIARYVKTSWGAFPAACTFTTPRSNELGLVGSGTLMAPYKCWMHMPDGPLRLACGRSKKNEIEIGWKESTIFCGCPCQVKVRVVGEVLKHVYSNFLQCQVSLLYTPSVITNSCRNHWHNLVDSICVIFATDSRTAWSLSKLIWPTIIWRNEQSLKL